jgi:hypothetical protein
VLGTVRSLRHSAFKVCVGIVDSVSDITTTTPPDGGRRTYFEETISARDRAHFARHAFALRAAPRRRGGLE